MRADTDTVRKCVDALGVGQSSIGTLLRIKDWILIMMKDFMNMSEVLYVS